jgi:hypothetical protein
MLIRLIAHHHFLLGPGGFGQVQKSYQNETLKKEIVQPVQRVPIKTRQIYQTLFCPVTVKFMPHRAFFLSRGYFLYSR